MLPALALGAGLSYLSGKSQADMAQGMQNTQFGFQQQLANQFALDPLMQMAMRNVNQQGFNPKEVLSRGMDQIQGVQRRRDFEASRNLAQYGFQPGSPQTDFMQQAQQQSTQNAQDQLRGLVNMQSPMSQMQNNMANVAGYNQALQPQIGMAAGGMV
jgi:hypothetical protein